MHTPKEFKWRHNQGDVILQCVRWYCKYNLSYRDLKEIMSERGIAVDHTTLYRWVQHYAPKLKQKLTRYNQRCSCRWYLDETYLKVKGRWKYLYRAIDEQGNTLDFYLSHRRNAYAAKRFIKKLLGSHPESQANTINTDKNPAYTQAIRELKNEHRLKQTVVHRQVKYCNNPNDLMFKECFIFLR